MEPTVSSVAVSNWPGVGARQESKLTFSYLPVVGIQDCVNEKTRLGPDKDCGEHGRVYKECALEKEMQRPLCSVIFVPADYPSLRLSLEERLERHPQRGFLAMPALSYPLGVDVLGHVVCVCLGQEPADYGSDHGRQDQSSGAGQGTTGDTVERCLVVAGARL